MPARPITSTALSSRSSRNLSGRPDLRQLTPRKHASSRLKSLLRETGAEPGDARGALCRSAWHSERYTERDCAMSPLQKKWLLFRTFLAQLEGLAGRGPVLMVLEDAHWLDPTSRELFDQMVDRLQRLPVLLVVTFRPDSLSAVDRLSSCDAAHAEPPGAGTGPVFGRAGRPAVRRCPPEVLEQILARTEGVPLFTEELTKTVLESRLLGDAGDHYVLAGPLPPSAIPATLHNSLMARLDRLAPG